LRSQAYGPSHFSSLAPDMFTQNRAPISSASRKASI